MGGPQSIARSKRRTRPFRGGYYGAQRRRETATLKTKGRPMKYYDKKDKKVKPIKWAFVAIAVIIYVAFVAFCLWQGAI